MKRDYLLYILAASLVLNLLLGIALVLTIPAMQLGRQDPTESTQPQIQESPTLPPETSIPETTIPLEPTAPPTTQPPETQPPQTEPPKTEPLEEYIGSLYTRQELEKLDNTLIPYGPGYAKNGDAAPYAPGAQDKYGKYGASFLRTDKNVIYLTFDCGYEYFVDGQPLTGKILDTLKEKDVKAVFFVTMSYVKSNPDLVRRMIDEGHAVGNHSADHYSMPSLTIDEMVEQIMELHHYVEEKFGYSMNLYRPPSGEFSLRSLAVTQSLGYETVHWSFAYADWDTSEQPEKAAALERILGCHHDGAIYLLHAVSETNADVLSEVIDGLRDKGYSLELLTKR